MSGDTGPEQIYCLEYPGAIRLKFIILLVCVVFLFLVREFYIHDVSWIILGVIVTGAAAGYYYLRICRTVCVTGDGISQNAGTKEWTWTWRELQQVIEKYQPNQMPGRPGMRRITVIHSDGRDISFDTHMGTYRDPALRVIQAAKAHNIPIEQREVSFFFLVYW
jgi:hypothetical protein